MRRVGVRRSLEGISVRDFVELLGEVGGFNAVNLHDAAKAIAELKRRGGVLAMSITGNLLATGVREIVAYAVSKGLVDVIVTTAGALDHDIARSLGGEYYVGSFDMDDVDLASRGYHRLGNVLIPKEHYGILVEKFVHRTLEEVEGGDYGTYELAWLFGARIEDELSVLRQAYLRKVPLFVPGIIDGAVGTAILTHNDMRRSRGRPPVRLDLFKDERELANRFSSAETLGALIVGGGIAKHHVIWWSQFRGGLDVAVYVTTAVEYDGSLSGARPKEAISWGKVKPNAEVVHVFSDATIALPILLLYSVNDVDVLPKNRGDFRGE